MPTQFPSSLKSWHYTITPWSLFNPMHASFWITCSWRTYQVSRMSTVSPVHLRRGLGPGCPKEWGAKDSPYPYHVPGWAKQERHWGGSRILWTGVWTCGDGDTISRALRVNLRQIREFDRTHRTPSLHPPTPPPPPPPQIRHSRNSFTLHSHVQKVHSLNHSDNLIV